MLCLFVHLSILALIFKLIIFHMFFFCCNCCTVPFLTKFICFFPSVCLIDQIYVAHYEVRTDERFICITLLFLRVKKCLFNFVNSWKLRKFRACRRRSWTRIYIYWHLGWLANTARLFFVLFSASCKQTDQLLNLIF